MSDKYDCIKLKNQLCFPIYLCAKEIVNSYAEPLAELDLTYTQYVLMMYFWEKGSSNAKELSETLLLDPSTVTPLLKKLEKKGYITKEYSGKDRRNLVIKITEKGMELRDKALSVPGAMRKCIDLSEEEGISLYMLIYKILNNIKKGNQYESDTSNREQF